MVEQNEQTLVVASHNPVKIEAARAAVQRLFPEVAWRVVPVAVASGVADQPLTAAETLAGALNRTRAAQQAVPEGTLWIGLEGGVEPAEPGLAAFAWVVVRSATQTGQARSGTFFLPPAVADLVQQGLELGEADDRVFGHTNSKQQGGAVGLLTHQVLTRQALYEQAVLLALIPFLNPHLYPAAAVGAANQK
jgi:inosine/xanthosine triphosphatase